MQRSLTRTSVLILVTLLHTTVPALLSSTQLYSARFLPGVGAGSISDGNNKQLSGGESSWNRVLGKDHCLVLSSNSCLEKSPLCSFDRPSDEDDRSRYVRPDQLWWDSFITKLHLCYFLAPVCCFSTFVFIHFADLCWKYWDEVRSRKQMVAPVESRWKVKINVQMCQVLCSFPHAVQSGGVLLVLCVIL